MEKSYNHNFEDVKINRILDNYPEPTHLPAKAHSDYEIFFAVGGNSDIILENNRYKLKKNTLLLIKPHQLHAIDIYGEDIHSIYIIRFDKNILSENLQNKLSTIDSFYTVNDEHMLSIFSKFDSYSSKYTGEDLHDILISLITELLFELHYSYTQIQPDVINKKMDDILQYINNNLSDKITLDSLCKQFYQSKTWLYHAFMESVSVSPIKYIESKRLTLANDLIMAGNRPTKIYATCGYSDYSSFYRAYVSFFKHSPTTMKPKKPAKKKKKSSKNNNN